MEPLKIMAAPFILMAYLIQLIYEIVVSTISVIIWITSLFLRKRVKRLPTGQKVITYDDGREFIELTSKHSDRVRLVPSTPDLLAKLAEGKKLGRYKRLVNFIND